MEKLEYLKDLFNQKKNVILGGVILLIILVIVGFIIYKNISSSNNSEELKIVEDIIEKEETEIEVVEKCEVTVDIKGEIKNPGVYKIDCEKRVQDVIELAGGLTSNSDTSVINLGKKVVDEMVIIIYSKTQVENFVQVKEDETIKNNECVIQEEVKNDACINNSDINSSTDDNVVIEDNTKDTSIYLNISINNATKEELMQLPGIGESKAINIINHRNEIGKFTTLEQLKDVKGIGDSIFEKIKQYITL